jgi:hypothetical protein
VLFVIELAVQILRFALEIGDARVHAFRAS